VYYKATRHGPISGPVMGLSSVVHHELVPWIRHEPV
jgi:hypothetical protein